MIYWFLFSFLALGALLFSTTRGNPATRNLWIILASFVLACVAGLRQPGVGSDYSNYVSAFSRTPGIADLLGGEALPDIHMETGFLLLNSFVRTFTNDPALLFLLVAFLTCGLVAWSSIRLTPYAGYAFLIYFSYDFYQHGFTAIRFGLACAIALLMIYQLTEQRRISALASAGVATSIHSSALLLFPLYFATFIPFRRQYILLGVSGSLLLGALPVVEPAFAQLLPDFIPRAESIRQYVRHSSYGESLGFLGLINIKYLMLMSILWWFWNRIERNVPGLHVMAWALLSATVLRVGFHDLGFIVGRGAMLLGMVEIVFITSIAFIFRERLIALSLVIAYAAVTLILNMSLRGMDQYYWIL